MVNIVPVTEKILQKNGILRRILLIFERIIRILNNKNYGEMEINDTFEKLDKTCYLIDYYYGELLQITEAMVYSIFEKTKYYSLIRVLKHQQNVGRELIRVLKELSKQKHDSGNISGTIRAISDYTYMYRAIMSREDTIIVSLIRKVLDPLEFVNLSYDFKIEVLKHYGKSWKKNILEKIIDIERALGIESLSQYTPILDPKEQEFLDLKHFVTD